MIELRWVRPGKTTTEPDRLQWRVVDDDHQGEVVLQDWTDVPVVVVCDSEL